MVQPEGPEGRGRDCSRRRWTEFFAACDKIKAAGKICLALGPQWTAMHLFENVMIGSLGAEEWGALWTGGSGLGERRRYDGA